MRFAAVAEMALESSCRGAREDRCSSHPAGLTSRGRGKSGAALATVIGKCRFHSHGQPLDAICVREGGSGAVDPSARRPATAPQVTIHEVLEAVRVNVPERSSVIPRSSVAPAPAPGVAPDLAWRRRDMVPHRRPAGGDRSRCTWSRSAMLVLLVAPHHYTVGHQVFGFGLGITAYTLGMRHAFDADHIAAIDNTTRKLMADGKRPVSGRVLVRSRTLHRRGRAGRPRRRRRPPGHLADQRRIQRHTRLLGIVSARRVSASSSTSSAS